MKDAGLDMLCNEYIRSENKVSPFVERDYESKNRWREHVLLVAKDSTRTCSPSKSLERDNKIERVKRIRKKEIKR